MTTTPTEVPGQIELGELLRDQGVARVAASNDAWMGRALDQLSDLAATFPYLTADDLHTRMTFLGDEPTHPNAYGAVFRSAVRLGYIEATDATCRSQRPDAHARRLIVWRSLCLPW